uniref:Gamma-glutamyltransferase n=1 Tax=Phenylobacterium glaciei TaxID=2803784 RepID=A0A974P2N4_9CAUL|nr:gamma-glutamyltransferase [Phenylobacterium glaciei]
MEPGGTSHMVIVDAAGNAVSMTTTVESIFGNGRMVNGFFLNNQLTDFSFAPKEKDGVPAANAVAGGKRPRSSMAPAVVLDQQGRFVAALGSPAARRSWPTTSRPWWPSSTGSCPSTRPSPCPT